MSACELINSLYWSFHEDGTSDDFELGPSSNFNVVPSFLCINVSTQPCKMLILIMSLSSVYAIYKVNKAAPFYMWLSNNLWNPIQNTVIFVAWQQCKHWLSNVSQGSVIEFDPISWEIDSCGWFSLPPTYSLDSCKFDSLDWKWNIYFTAKYFIVASSRLIIMKKGIFKKIVISIDHHIDLDPSNNG